MKKEYLYAGISILLWSTTATISKILLDSLNSIQILLISSFCAFITLLIINISQGKIKQLKKYKLKNYIELFFIGILGTFLYDLLFYLGIDRLKASQAFIINYLWPIMIILFACIILKEKLTFRKIISVVISFIGVIFVASDGNIFYIGKNNLIGALFCVLAAISYGLFSVLNKQKNYDKFLSMMIFCFNSFILSLIYILLTKEWYIPNINQFIGLFWIGSFTVAIALTTWALALEKGDTAKISNIAYITPFLSIIWSSIILKEKISIYSIIGLLIIILGIFIQMQKDNEI